MRQKGSQITGLHVKAQIARRISVPFDERKWGTVRNRGRGGVSKWRQTENSKGPYGVSREESSTHLLLREKQGTKQGTGHTSWLRREGSGCIQEEVRSREKSQDLYYKKYKKKYNKKGD